jgi:hypothetical protein
MSQVSSSASSSANSVSGDTLYDIDSNGVECVVCREAQPLCSFPDKITDTCDHSTIHTCQPCVEQVILQALEGKEWNDPACPECNASLSLNNVQEFGTAAQAETYSNRLMKRALQSMEDYRECLSPICNSGQLHDGGEDYPIVTCHSCQAKSCYTHRIPFHFDQTCDGFDENIRQSTERENFERSIVLVKQLSKTCPGCKFDIEKTTGCDHVSNEQTSTHKYPYSQIDDGRWFAQTVITSFAMLVLRLIAQYAKKETVRMKAAVCTIVSFSVGWLRFRLERTRKPSLTEEFALTLLIQEAVLELLRTSTLLYFSTLTSTVGEKKIPTYVNTTTAEFSRLAVMIFIFFIFYGNYAEYPPWVTKFVGYPSI